MRGAYYILLLFFAFRLQAMCENINDLKKGFNSAIYDVSNVFITSKARVFFHSLPIYKCKSKKFIINGDKAISYASYNGFQYVSYLDKKGAVHTGWIESSHISRQDTSLKPLKIEKRDFSIHFNGTDIRIGDSYSEALEAFEKITEIDSGNAFIDLFRTVNGVDYKFYPHDFGFIYIESSNLNYDKLKRDFDDYSITKIVLKRGVGFSNRGISVGSKMLDVLKVYGTPTLKKDGKFIYINTEGTISFTGSETVSEIDIFSNPL